MEPYLFYSALITFIMFLLLGFDMYWRRKPIMSLIQIPPLEDSKKTRISVIIPARNEERNIEEALQSILHLDYENLEIILVDDRSTDKTGEIIDRMAKTNPKVHIVHLTELPKGWLGKNHAMYEGAKHATGEYILFTDADVVMEPSILRRALRYMQENKIDHLALGPVAIMPGVLLKIFTTAFVVFFGLFAKPWKVRNPKSKAHIGIGAFNFVKADVYRKIGTHQAIAMRPDDDMKLGKLVKINGYAQDYLFGKDLLSVEWYSSVSELVKGLEKNSYAGVNYSLWVIFYSTVVTFILFLWPFIGIFLTHGMTQVLNLLIVIMILSHSMYVSQFSKVNPLYCLGFPLGVLMFMFILWRSTLLTLLHDGIDWRDTHYSLQELKANKL